MKGSLQITEERLDGSSECILPTECNYVLEQSRAYLLNHLYSGKLEVDPITSFRIGKGGVPVGSPKYPLDSKDTDIARSMYSELRCTNETDNYESIFDRFRIVHNLQSIQPSVAAITHASPRSVTYTFYLDYHEANGLKISEVGMFTKSGKLFNHKTFPEYIKIPSAKLTFKWTLEYIS